MDAIFQTDAAKKRQCTRNVVVVVISFGHWDRLRAEVHCWTALLHLHIFKMATLRQLSKLPVSRLATRHFSLASRSAAYIRVDPTPYERAEADSSLSALLEKEKGPWSALTKEEKLQRKFVVNCCSLVI